MNVGRQVTENAGLWSTSFEGNGELTLTRVSSPEMDFSVAHAYLDLVHAFPNPGMDALEHIASDPRHYFYNPEAAFLPTHLEVLKNFRWLNEQLIYEGRPIGKELVQHSVGVALMAQELATASSEWGIPIDPDWAFTGGLLHDYGKIHIAQEYPYLLDPTYEYQNGDSEKMAQHTEIGAEVITKLGSVDQATIPAMVAKFHHAYKPPQHGRKKINYELDQLNSAAHQLLIVIAITDMVEATASREYVPEEHKIHQSLMNLDFTRFADANIELPSDPFLRATDIVGNYFNLIRADGSVCNSIYHNRRGLSRRAS